MTEPSAMFMDPASVVDVEPNQFLELSSILFQCFAVIVLGYIAGKYNLINESESNGLTNFISHFSLPALISQSLAQSDLSRIDWNFVVAVGISKLLIFFLVVVVTLITSFSVNIGVAGIFGLFVTIGNDFAVGYPLFASLYKNHHTNFPDYLYVVAPIQFVLINPLGIFMMELQKYREQKQAVEFSSQMRIFFKVSTKTLLNPIVAMTVAGLIWNIVFGPSIPPMLSGVLHSLGQTFAPTSLFLLGVKTALQTDRTNGFFKFKVPCILTGVKLIVFPLLLRFLSQHLVKGDEDHKEALSDFAFLYGMIPAAPTSMIFALKFNIAPWIMSSGLIISAIVSAPLMFVSASMISFPYATTDQFLIEITQAVRIISFIAIPCAIWTLFLYICGSRWTSATYRITFFLIFNQAFLSISSYLLLGQQHRSKFFYFLPSFALYMSRFLTTLIALTLCLINRKSLSYIRCVQNTLLCISVIFCLISLQLIDILSSDSANNSIRFRFLSGFYEKIISLVTVALNLVITTLSVIIFQHRSMQVDEKISSTIFHKYSLMTGESDEESGENVACKLEGHKNPDEPSEYEKYLIESFDQSDEESDRKRHNSSINHLKDCCGNLYRASDLNDDDFLTISLDDYAEVEIHFALVLMMLFGMIVDFVTSLTVVVGSRVSGTSRELMYLDVFLNYGQAITTFILFGIKLTPLIDWCRSLKSYKTPTRYYHELNAPISDETLHVCQQFCTYHRESCASSICFTVKPVSQKILAFRGRDLVRWLVRNGLCPDRRSAQLYARQLFIGNVIRRFEESSQLMENTSVYRFSNNWLPCDKKTLKSPSALTE